MPDVNERKPREVATPGVLRNRSFVWFTTAQFLGAFNDNLFKQLVLLLAALWLFPGQDKQAIATITFALPFLLFSGIAGELSERFSKRTVIVWMKLLEVVTMLGGATALQLRSWPLLLAVLFLMGTHSAFFGPSKYGIVPEIVEAKGLMSANGCSTASRTNCGWPVARGWCSPSSAGSVPCASRGCRRRVRICGSDGIRSPACCRPCGNCAASSISWHSCS
jgi:MFS family permease